MLRRSSSSYILLTPFLCKIEEANIADYFLSEYYDNAQQYHAQHKTVGLAGPSSPSGFQRPNGGEGNLGALPGKEHPPSLNNDPPAALSGLQQQNPVDTTDIVHPNNYPTVVHPYGDDTKN